MKRILKYIFTLIFILSISLYMVSCNVENQNPNDDTFNITDTELLNLDGHPTFWSDLSESESFWEDYDDGRVSLDGEKYKETNIIYIDSIGNKKIEDIEICFSNSTELNNLTIEEALPIIKEYLPVSLIRERYECYDSFVAQPKDVTNKTNYYYVCYKIKEEMTEYTDYFYIAYIEIKVVDNIVHHFRIAKGHRPNWTNKLDLNGYNRINWSHDFVN